MQYRKEGADKRYVCMCAFHLLSVIIPDGMLSAGRRRVGSGICSRFIYSTTSLALPMLLVASLANTK